MLSSLWSDRMSVLSCSCETRRLARPNSIFDNDYSYWAHLELEGKAKQQFNKAENAVANKVPESAGGKKMELYSGKF